MKPCTKEDMMEYNMLHNAVFISLLHHQGHLDVINSFTCVETITKVFFLHEGDRWFIYIGDVSQLF